MPDEISILTNLQILDLSKNYITEISDIINKSIKKILI
jgi:Leucine-rich repeat (LRR) protein